MNPPSKDIVSILEADSDFALLVPSDGELVFYSQMPAGITPCVSIHDTGGFDEESGYDYQKPTIQVKVRAATYDQAYELAYTAKQALHNLTNKVENLTRYVAIWSMSDILSLGVDEDKKHLVSVNFRLHRTAST